MADASITESAVAGLTLLDAAKPLASSLLWQLQQDFYREASIRAWSDAIVPNFVTSNAFIASCYARVIMGFIRDWFAKPSANRSQPIYIVEVGAGHGRLSYLILRELMALHEQWPALAPAGAAAAAAAATTSSSGAGSGPVAPFRYVVTDFTESNVAFWQAHECLAPFFASGVLDAAVWNAEGGGAPELHLVRSGTTLSAPGVTAAGAGVTATGTGTGNPIIAVANYVFDTLRQDAYRIVEGQLQQALAAVYSGSPADAEALAAGRTGAGATAAAASSAAAGTGIGGAVGASGDGATGIISRMRVAWSYASPCDASAVARGEAEALAAAGSRRAGTAAAAAAAGGVVTSVSSAAAASALASEQEAVHAAALTRILQVYALRQRNASVVVPTGGLRALHALSALSGGRVFALVGDKAYGHEEEVAGTPIRDPHVAVHGSFSMMVNLHAARLYALARGGFSLHTPQLDGFKVAALAIGLGGEGAGGASAGASGVAPAADVSALSDVHVPDSALTFPETLAAWADCMDTFGPDNFAALQRCVKDEITPAPSLRTALSVLRLACWDADVFHKFRAVFIDGSTAASDKTQADMVGDVTQVEARYFPLQASRDVAFELGRVCMGLKQHHKALALFRASVRQCGDHHVTQYNIGICYSNLEDHATAMAHFDASLRLKHDYAESLVWRGKMEAKLQGLAFQRAADQAAASLEAAAAAAAGTPLVVAGGASASAASSVSVADAPSPHGGAAASGGSTA